ncbi:MAG: NADH dehydrogenase ubiquinone Fe-S protein 4, partial [Alphaproteobacteria bacterium]
SSDDTRQQLKLWFGSKEEAIEYAQAKGLVYQIEEPKTRKIRPKAYADNFANDRLLRWTH